MWSVHISIVKVRANEEHIVGQFYKTFFHFIDAIEIYIVCPCSWTNLQLTGRNLGPML